MNIQSLQTDKIPKWLNRSLIMVFVSLSCSAGLAYIPFSLLAHGHLDLSLPWIIEFYQQGTVHNSTLIWYLLFIMLFGIGWLLSKRAAHGLGRNLLRIGLFLVLLTPSIFISPVPEFPAALVNPEVYADQKTEAIVLPAIASIVKYLLEPLSFAIPSLVALSLWPVLAMWFVVLLMIVAHKLRAARASGNLN